MQVGRGALEASAIFRKFYNRVTWVKAFFSPFAYSGHLNLGYNVEDPTARDTFPYLHPLFVLLMGGRCRGLRINERY